MCSVGGTGETPGPPRSTIVVRNKAPEDLLLECMEQDLSVGCYC